MTNKKINNNFEQESGRSMVEMLGVLAIIGVLSVGGISGYTTAMNKHKANEILNAAAIRAMAVSAQIQSGVDPSTETGSVTTEDVGSVKIGSASPVGTEQFKLVFTSNIDGPICDQMKNIAGDNSAVGVACDRLLYNNDMSTGVENKNVDSVDNDGNYTCKTAGFDPDSKCESCTTGYTGLSCNTCAEGYESDGEGGCQEVQTCKGAKSVGDDCEDNEGLCPGYYCQIAAGSSQTGSRCCGTNKYTPGAGTIAALTVPTTIDSTYYEGPQTNWDDAKLYCEGLKIAHEAGVKIGGTDYPITTGLATLPSSCSYSSICSDLPQSGGYWLDQLVQPDCSSITPDTTYGSASCNAFYLYYGYVNDGGVAGYARSTGDFVYALCK